MLSMEKGDKQAFNDYTRKLVELDVALKNAMQTYRQDQSRVTDLVAMRNNLSLLSDQIWNVFDKIVAPTGKIVLFDVNLSPHEERLYSSDSE